MSSPLLALKAAKKEPTVKECRWRLDTRAGKKQNPSRIFAKHIDSLALDTNYLIWT